MKHEVNKSIRYGGYNAREIQELGRLNESEQGKLRAELDNIKKVWWVFPDWLMGVAFLVALAALFYLSSPITRIVCGVVSLYCAVQFSYRLGVYYGFMRGYQEGHQLGVHRVLGISDEQAGEINERATEMEIDDKLVKSLDKL